MDWLSYLLAIPFFGLIGCMVLFWLLSMVASWRGILKGFRNFIIVIAVLLGGLFALGAVVAAGIFAWEHFEDQRLMKECLTAYERQNKANAAPNDYFGKQLREAAAEEAKRCATFAAKKQAADSRTK